MKASVIILTYNSIATIAETLNSVVSFADDIHIVDSFSTDGTVETALAHGAHVVRHPFENYGAQRNWAISSLSLKHDWQLHLDADERLTPELVAEISSLSENVDVNGFYIPRALKFLGRPIRHGGMFPTWHLRLFRSGCGRCETRKYDQHFYLTTGSTAHLKAYMVDDIRLSLSEWTARHNRWADAEVEEQIAGDGESRVAGKFSGNQVEKKRYWRGLYDRSPLFFRPLALFFYRFVVRLGFLDGATGFIFYVLQTFWFRFLIDSKLFERRLAQEAVTRRCSSKAAALAKLSRWGFARDKE